MTYQARSGTRPIYATTGVILVHTGLAYLMVFGFAPPGFIVTPETRTAAVTYETKPEDLPKPPEPKQIEDAQIRPTIENAYIPPKPYFEDTGPTITFDPIPSAATDDLALGGTIDSVGGFEANLFTSRGPRPINNVARWVTNDEYPRSAIIREEQGVAGFQLRVSAKGQVQDCTITASSGSHALDEATCRWVTKRAKFEPAINQYGENIAGTYSNSVNWKLP
ncbi:MAG TPA: TonB family protein [Sphingomonadaceae bacterium]|nr:TonB family protein [Sphingomonadaceae bacterium]